MTSYNHNDDKNILCRVLWYMLYSLVTCICHCHHISIVVTPLLKSFVISLMSCHSTFHLYLVGIYGKERSPSLNPCDTSKISSSLEVDDFLNQAQNRPSQISLNKLIKNITYCFLIAIVVLWPGQGSVFAKMPFQPLPTNNVICLYHWAKDICVQSVIRILCLHIPSSLNDFVSLCGWLVGCSNHSEGLKARLTIARKQGLILLSNPSAKMVVTPIH